MAVGWKSREQAWPLCAYIISICEERSNVSNTGVLAITSIRARSKAPLLTPSPLKFSLSLNQ